MKACTKKWSTHCLKLLTMNWRTQDCQYTFRATLALKMTTLIVFSNIFNPQVQVAVNIHEQYVYYILYKFYNVICNLYIYIYI